MVQAPREPDQDGDMSSEEPGGTTELDRFRDLARKLVQVPKEEIDAERAKEEQRKEDERGERHSLPVSPA
jgi:hypothetical protein